MPGRQAGDPHALEGGSEEHLTRIADWEILVDSLGLAEGDGDGDVLLVIGGAGGVGSILIQLAKKLTGLHVVATASRPETRAWVETLGADLVVDHRQPLDERTKALGVSPRYVAALDVPHLAAYGEATEGAVAELVFHEMSFLG